MQEAEFQFFSNSVMKEIMYGKRENIDQNQIEDLLKDAGLWELRNRHPFSLSGGQMQKLTLLLAYFSEKKIVVLDEPTSGLDKKSLMFCADLIEKMKNEKIVIVISHDLEFLAYAMDRCIKIENGIITEDTKDFVIADLYRSMSLPNGVIKEKNSISEKPSYEIALDPRVNLLFLLITVIIVGIGNPRYIFINSILLLISSLANKRFKAFLTSALIFSLIYGLAIVHPTATTIFISNYIPRFLLIVLIFPIILGGEGATYLLAALRKMGIS